MRPISGKELCKLLHLAGWTLKRVNGSHHIFGKSGEPINIAVPVHGGQMIKPGLATKIAKIADITW